MFKTIIKYGNSIHEYTNRTEKAAFRQHYPAFNYRMGEYYGQVSGDFRIIDTKTGKVVFNERF